MLWSLRTVAQVPLPLLPSGIAYDAAGNLYIADTNRHVVYESSLAGVLTVVAGSGVQGFGGDGGAATAAMLNSPQAVAVASDGTLYIADTGNQRIRTVTPAGVISTFAGTGERGFGGDGGPATQAEFSQPVALALDASGALLIADSGNHRVRRVSSGAISTVAGSGVQGFGGDGAAATAALLDTPSGVAVMADGRIVIADSHNQRLRVFAANGTMATLAGTGAAGFSGDGGAATQAKLSLPRGLVAMPDGSVVFADSNNQRLRSVSATGIITTIAGNGVQGVATDATAGASASLNTPRGVASSSFGAAVFADTPNRLVRALVNGDVYSAAGLVNSRTTLVTLSSVTPAAASVSVTGAVGTPQGVVQIREGSTVLGQGTLAAGVATVTLPQLSVGTHVLAANYLGDGLNPAASSATTTLTTSAAATSTVLQQPSGGYAGMPVVLTASVSSAAGGSPSGAVVFFDSGTQVSSASVALGVATGTWLTPSAGTHSLVAKYSGDANFLPSASAAEMLAVNAMPDFTIAVAGSASQVAQVGTLATFQIAVGAQPGPFSGPVSLSASGLPAGVAVTFSPVSVVPGSGTSTVTMSIPTATLLGAKRGGSPLVWFAIAPLLLAFRRRRRALSACCLLLLVGCGDRVAPENAGKTKAYSVTITGTATNLAGAVVTHSAVVQLTVE